MLNAVRFFVFWLNVLRRRQAKLWSAAEFAHWQRAQQADAQPAQPQHPRHDELAELAEIFRLTTQSLREWAVITVWQPGLSRFSVADTGFNRWACKLPRREIDLTNGQV